MYIEFGWNKEYLCVNDTGLNDTGLSVKVDKNI